MGATEKIKQELLELKILIFLEFRPFMHNPEDDWWEITDTFSHFWNTQMRIWREYRVGGSVGLGEKSGLSEIADIKGFLVLEYVEIVALLVLKNW